MSSRPAAASAPVVAGLAQLEARGFRRRRRLCESRRRRAQRRSHATHRSGRRRAAPVPARPSWSAPGELGADSNSSGASPTCHPPSSGSGRSSSCSGGRVADFIALVAEIEFQIFAGVGFLLAVAEGAIERIVGFQFVPVFSRVDLAGSPVGAFAGAAGILRSKGSRCSELRSLDANFRLRRGFVGRGVRAMLAFDYVAFDRRLERACARPRGADRARRLRFTLGRLWSRFAHSWRAPGQR